jgi:hypothetical protein
VPKFRFLFFCDVPGSVKLQALIPLPTILDESGRPPDRGCHGRRCGFNFAVDSTVKEEALCQKS